MSEAPVPSEIPEILDRLRRGRRFLVTGHVRSDGDALGSQLAMHHFLRTMGKETQVVCDRGAAPEYRFLPDSHRVQGEPEDLRPPYDAILVFDTGSFERLERLQAPIAAMKPFIINIDHHSSNKRFGTLNWIEPTYSSTGEMVYEVIHASGMPMNKDMATCLYVALVTDTGRFSFSNTNVRSHRVAADLIAHGVEPGEMHTQLFRNKDPGQLKLMARVIESIRFSDDRRTAWVALTRSLLDGCGFVPNETQEYIDVIKSLKDVDVAVLFREGDEPGTTKVSMRTSPTVDAVVLASLFHGGGHPRAAGCTVRSGIDEAAPKVIREITNYLRGR